MSVLLPKSAWKAGIGFLGGLCLAAGVAAAAPSSSAGTQFQVDHQLCYTATGKFTIPKVVILINQFSPNGFSPTIRPGLALHCNPVRKTAQTPNNGTQIFKITNPHAHLACLPLSSAQQQPTPKVVVTNQFGSATLVPLQPNLLCLPSWKSLTGPPMKSPRTPPGLNHFTCYPVAVASGGYQPPPVLLKDEFTKKDVTAQVNPVPQELCLPTEKIVGKHVFPIIDPATHLLCFPVTQTPKKTPIWDENQFGISKVKVIATQLLCVPSTKQVVGQNG